MATSTIPQPLCTVGVGFPFNIVWTRYIGSKISLISNSNIRYEGILYTINTQESTIALQSVRSFGTEGRKVPEIPPSSEIYDFIIFRGQDMWHPRRLGGEQQRDIKDLTVLEGSGGGQGNNESWGAPSKGQRKSARPAPAENFWYGAQAPSWGKGRGWDKGYEKGYEKSYDKGYEKGYDRYDKGGYGKSPEKGKGKMGKGEEKGGKGKGKELEKGKSAKGLDSAKGKKGMPIEGKGKGGKVEIRTRDFPGTARDVHSCVAHSWFGLWCSGAFELNLPRRRTCLHQQPSAPVTLLLALFGLQVGLGLDNTENNGSRSRSRGLVEFGLLMSLLVCAASLQGCSLEIPTHDRANWSRQPNYLIKYEHVGPGQPSSAAILNSCSVGASTRQVCSGHGQCVPWMKTPLSLAKPGDAVANMGVAFCECDSGWADPECRTVRKSQLKAFFLSLFGGFLGLKPGKQSRVCLA
eukprot:g30187.t1